MSLVLVQKDIMPSFHNPGWHPFGCSMPTIAVPLQAPPPWLSYFRFNIVFLSPMPSLFCHTLHIIRSSHPTSLKTVIYYAMALFNESIQNLEL